VRSALGNLPRTLDATYERILYNIPQEYRKEAHCALQLLTVSYEPLTLLQVAEAVAVDCDSKIFDCENRLREPEALLEICSSLLTLWG
jgi:ankyrin repeat domain-containing protein 50